MPYQAQDVLLAAERRNAEAASPSKLTIPVTAQLKAIVNDICEHTKDRVSETERWYFRDVARGRVQCADFARIAFGARRSRIPADQRELLAYVRSLVQVDDRRVIPFERALLRKAIEEAEANAAIERCRFQETPEALRSARAEISDDIAAMQELLRSIDARLEQVQTVSA